MYFGSGGDPDLPVHFLRDKDVDHSRPGPYLPGVVESTPNIDTDLFGRSTVVPSLFSFGYLIYQVGE